MNARLTAAVEELVARSTGEAARIVSSRGVSGGCISEARVARLADGRELFVKSNPSPLEGLFEREAEGLAALRAVGAIRVPQPLGTGGAAGSDVPPFIVLEAISLGRPGAGLFEDFGRCFAELHRRGRGERFGFEHDNWIGATAQPNGWGDSWVEFWREHRLGFQLRLAREHGRTDSRFDRLGDRLLDRLDELIGAPDEPPALLHGDLWSGNYLVDESGAPVLIDPAVYYGRREADLAMTRLFGGFSPSFYAAYEEVWPLADGTRARQSIYELYHLLNHLNLFGSSYRAGCLAILERFAG